MHANQEENDRRYSEKKLRTKYLSNHVTEEETQMATGAQPC
jgi:hypothetical protein